MNGVRMRALGTAILLAVVLSQLVALGYPLVTISGPLTREANGLTCASPCETEIAARTARAFEPMLAVQPGSAKRLVLTSTDFDGLERRFMDRWLHIRVSSDAGGTWSEPRFPAGPDGEPGGALRSCATWFDPVAAVLPNGHAFVGGVAYRRDPLFSAVPLGGTFLIARLADGDQSFTDLSVVPDGRAAIEGACSGRRSAASSADKPFLMTGADGSIVASWSPTATLESPVSLARSFDEGRTWTSLPQLGGNFEHPYSAAMAMSRTGTIAIVFTDGSGGDKRGTMVGILSGDAWRFTTVDPEGGRYPSIQFGKGPTRDRLYVAYPVSDSVGEAPAIRYSDDLGRTWSASNVLDLPQAPGATVPTLGVDGRGWAFVGFYHHLPDGSNQYRVAAFNGQSELGPVIVSRTPIGHQDLSLSLGHYMGIAGLDSGAHVVWVAGSVPLTGLMGARVSLT